MPEHLQDALLPAGVPVTQRAETAALYLVAGDSAGGDWFDAFVLDDGRLVVAVGDVVGRGVDAAVAMAGLRVLFEESMREHGDVVLALEALDRRAGRLSEASAATMCVCVLIPTSGELVYCTAGHPAPVVVSDGKASYLAGTGCGPLRSGRGFRVTSRRLATGDVLFLYSDGLLERAGRAPAEGAAEVLRAVEDAAAQSEVMDSHEPAVERACRRTVESLTGSTGYADDVAVLALQPVPPLPDLVLALPAVADTVRVARIELDDWLEAARVGELDRMALLHAVGELVSNAVEHAYPDPGRGHEVRLRVALGTDGLVHVEVADDGRWQDRRTSSRGRGLAMARGLLDALRIERGDAGSRAVGRHRVGRPAVLLRSSAPSRTDGVQPFAIEDTDGLLRLGGTIDLRGAEQLRHMLDRVTAAGTRPVSLDLTAVDLLTSAAVQVLFDARAAGPVELLAPVGSPARHVLDVVGLSYES